jgi:NTP pyrophosphatase (non-canonical NTP hydrolase)
MNVDMAAEQEKTMDIYVSFGFIKQNLYAMIHYMGRMADCLVDSSKSLEDVVRPGRSDVCLAKFRYDLIEIADELEIDVMNAIKAKFILNGEKYPVEYCEGSVQKYTAYSTFTKITATSGHAIIDSASCDRHLRSERNDLSVFQKNVDSIAREAIEFSEKRRWRDFDRPEYLVMALNTEVAELCEIFQWKNSNQVSGRITCGEWDKAAQEIADIIIYSLKLEYCVCKW